MMVVSKHETWGHGCSLDSLIPLNTSLPALRLAEEFGFKLILDGASEAHLMLDDIKEAGVSVIVHPTMMRANGDGENMTMEMAAILDREGRYAYVNVAHSQLYGYNQPDQMLGMSWKTLYEPDELRRFEDEIMPAFTGAGRWR